MVFMGVLYQGQQVGWGGFVSAEEVGMREWAWLREGGGYSSMMF